MRVKPDIFFAKQKNVVAGKEEQKRMRTLNTTYTLSHTTHCEIHWSYTLQSLTESTGSK